MLNLSQTEQGLQPADIAELSKVDLLYPPQNSFINFRAQSELFLDPERKEASIALRFTFPLTPEMRDEIANSGIILPTQIESIEVLCASPEESLPLREKPQDDTKPSKEYPYGRQWIYTPDDINKRQTEMAENAINTLFSSVYHQESGDSYPFPWEARVARGRPGIAAVAKAIAGLLSEIANIPEGGTLSLSRTGKPIPDTTGGKILIIAGHGGGIGEHYLCERTSTKIDAAPTTVNTTNEYGQKPINKILTDPLIKKHDKPDLYAAIFVGACNMNNVSLSPTKVPTYYVFGRLTHGYHPSSGSARSTEILN